MDDVRNFDVAYMGGVGGPACKSQQASCCNPSDDANLASRRCGSAQFNQRSSFTPLCGQVDQSQPPDLRRPPSTERRLRSPLA